MYVINAIQPSELAAYSSVIPRMGRANFEANGIAPNSVIVGATLFREPVGVTVASPRVGNQDAAEIYCLHVSAKHRRMGVGTRLLRKLEAEAARAGFHRLEFFYMAESTNADTAVQFLIKSGWSQPEPHAYFCETQHERLSEAPWMKLTLSDDFEIFDWRELTHDERAYINRRKAEGWFPEPLDPFLHEESMQLAPGSLGLRFKGQLVGWSIVLHVGPGVVGCRTLFVDPALQGSARAVALLAESIRRTSGYRYIFDVCFERNRMRQFVDRRMAPYLDAIRTSNRSVKALAAAQV